MEAGLRAALLGRNPEEGLRAEPGLYAVAGRNAAVVGLPAADTVCPTHTHTYTHTRTHARTHTHTTHTLMHMSINIDYTLFTANSNR